MIKLTTKERVLSAFKAYKAYCESRCAVLNRDGERCKNRRAHMNTNICAKHWALLKRTEW